MTDTPKLSPELFNKEISRACTYCHDGRLPFEKDGGYWHEVARGGDLGGREPCLANQLHRLIGEPSHD